MRGVKRLRSYTVEEVAEALDVHPHTVREWQKVGLAPIDKRRPVMFHGAALVDFLTRRMAGRKRPCPPGHMYCLRCRKPRRPDAELVEYANDGGGNIKALCPVCCAIMNRRASASQYAAFCQQLLRTTTQGESGLRDRSGPSVNLDLKRVDS